MMSRRIRILAGVLLLVGAALAGRFLLRSPLDVRPAPLVISVQASYPGANAQTVVDTVVVPIEQQVSGVEGMLFMSSQSASDGSYTLHITFTTGTDLNMAQVLVQNRLALALPVIPALVQNEGITVTKMSPDPLVLVSLSSDGRQDRVFLSNYAILFVKDELKQIPGVAGVTLMGDRDYSMQVRLDPEKLAALESHLDVVAALAAQNVQVAAGPVGQQPAAKDQQLLLNVNTTGRLTTPEEFAEIIVKAAPDGRIVRLKDVARVELGGGRKRRSLNGKPTVVLSIHRLPGAKPSAVSRAVRDKLAELGAKSPEGLTLDVAFDFAPNLEEPNNPATPEFLVIDVDLPATVSAERAVRTLERAAELVRETSGVQDVRALTEHPFSLVRSRPCLVARLNPKDQRKRGRQQIAGDLRDLLHDEIPQAECRLSVPSAAAGFPTYGFPIEFVIEDHGNHGSAILRECAETLAERMSDSGKFTDVAVSSGLRREPVLDLEIDRTRCQALGVQLSDVFNTLQVYLGSYYVNNLSQVGRTWQVNVQIADLRFRDSAADILKLQVKNNQGQLVRLGTILSVRDRFGPKVIERRNLYPIERITANLAEGVPLTKAKGLCQTLADQEFGTKQLKLNWRSR